MKKPYEWAGLYNPSETSIYFRPFIQKTNVAMETLHVHRGYQRVSGDNFSIYNPHPTSQFLQVGPYQL